MKKQEILLNEIRKTYSREGKHSRELAYISDDRYASTLKAMTYELLDRQESNGRIGTNSIIEVWESYISPAKGTPKGGWMKHLYGCLRGTLFPHLGMPEDADEYTAARQSLLTLMYSIFKYERKALPYNPRIEMPVITADDLAGANSRDEFDRTLKLFYEYKVYEMMRIGMDLHENNYLEHTCQVFYLSMFVGKQLNKLGIPVDLGIVSSAAATHDIGRFALKRYESIRIPDLHYYFTDYCLNSFNLPTVAHVAANYSPWDLEIENLSIEALLLIYASFRVCVTPTDDLDIIEIKSLQDSYDSFLEKQSNITEELKNRYNHVFRKISDFEGFLLNAGVNIELPKEPVIDPEVSDSHKEVDPSILFGDEIVEQLKYTAIDHSTRLMRHFTESKEFEKTIEFARSETHWMNKRTYLNIIGEYSSYMTEPQKDITLEFLYELLSDSASDIRMQAAAIMGKIVGKYREDYKKAIPNDSPLTDSTVVNLKLFKTYLELILSPENVYSGKQREWILSSLDSFVESAVRNCRPAARYQFFDALEEWYVPEGHKEEIIVSLCSAAFHIPSEMCTREFITTLTYFTKDVLGSYSKAVDLLVLDVMDHYFGDDSGQIDKRRMSILGVRAGELSESVITDLFLDNLKLSTSWIIKASVIRLLSNYVQRDDYQNLLLPVTMHFANLAMVSESINVRRLAGDALLEVLPMLTFSQRNEVVIELYHGLDMDDFQYLRALPDYFAKALLLLPPSELDEMVTCISNTITKGQEKPASASLITFAAMLENYDTYDFMEPEENRSARWIRIAGLLMKGMNIYNSVISQEALTAIGEKIFDSEILAIEDKKLIADHCFKRILVSTYGDIESNGLDFYNNATVLNKIYKFITEYQKNVGEFSTPYRDKIAFFPGTFDPFTNGHKTVTMMLRDMGYEVYLAIDQFDWTKKTLPHMLRKKIIQMSVADQEGIFVFPEKYPVNLRNKQDLKKLRELFGDRELHIVAGFNVVQDSLVYTEKPSKGSIHDMKHIVFAANRRNLEELEAINFNGIKGEIIKVQLKNFNPDASTQNVRESLDLERDISDLIDPVAQNYIYSKHFYSRETSKKVKYQEKEIEISSFCPESREALPAFTAQLLNAGYKCSEFREALDRPEVNSVYIANGHDKTPVAFAAAHIEGETAFLDAIIINYDQRIQKLGETLLTELTIGCINKGAKEIVYMPFDPADRTDTTYALLRRHGFVEAPVNQANEAIVLKCDITAPIVIFRDVEDVIKKPFKSNPRVVAAMTDAHNNLLETMNELYPGQAIISLTTSAIYSKIVDIVHQETAQAKAAGITSDDSEQKINQGNIANDFTLANESPYLAVPFGKILTKVLIPDTVTKALHIDRYYRDDLSSYSIRETVNYAGIADQISVLKSFDKPVILIDDILHSGDKAAKLIPMLTQQGIDIQKLIVAVLTQKGLDKIGDNSDRVLSPYFIPNITLWINEHDCYPFIGGDAIESKLSPENFSINLIAPYTTRSLVGTDDSRIHKFSSTCMLNTQSLLQVLREEYKHEFKKKLTLGRLGAVVSGPKLPILGVGLHYDDNISPTRYIDNDIKTLQRLQKHL